MIPHKSAVQYEAEVYKVIVTDQGNDTVHYFYNKDEAKQFCEKQNKRCYRYELGWRFVGRTSELKSTI